MGFISEERYALVWFQNGCSAIISQLKVAFLRFTPYRRTLRGEVITVLSLKARRGSALLAILWLFLPAGGNAAFQDLGLGARPVGMGGAFTAIADDSNAPLYNPAGIVQIQTHELSATYANLYSGLDLNAGNDNSSLNQGYFAFAARPLPHIGSLELSWGTFSATHLYREDTVRLTYARNLGDFFPILDNALALGLNLKYLRRSVTLDEFTANDPVFSGGTSASAATVDAGVLYSPHEGRLTGLRVGLAVNNLTRPDVGFQTVDKLPIEYRLGLAYQARQLQWIIPALDIVRRDDSTSIGAGVESWLLRNTLGVRAGVNRDEGAAGLSYFQKLGRNYGMRLDYGFTIPFFVEGSGGSHRVALSLYF